MEKVMEMVKTKRILAIIGIVGLFLGTIMPYYKFSFLGITKTIALWGYLEGKIMFILILALALFIFKDYIEKYAPQLFNNGVGKFVKKFENPKFSLVPTAIVIILAIYVSTLVETSDYIKFGLGFYMLWLGAICMVGHAIFYKGESATQEVQTTPNTMM
ncbi:MAG: hypothetical protein E7170_01845 [Firmicutes bacterium]|nr:hypothetical protein [Bacillota bacterium]